MLETAPSLSIYAKNNIVIDGVEERENGLEEKDDEEEEENSKLMKTLRIGDEIEEAVVGSGDFSFVKPENNMDLINEEEDEDDEEEEEGEEGEGEAVVPVSPPLFLATGLGIKDGPHHHFRVDKQDNEDYYRELLEEYPNHPLVLKYYAQFLQKKGDLEGAEEYYFRGIKADPGDGEILSEYALLVWELHHDQERASAFFELAAQTAPKDSDVLAAYAKFLWEIDEDDDSFVLPDPAQEKPIHSHLEKVIGGIHIDDVEAGDPKSSPDLENYYRRMSEENPSDPLYLRKYAQFLYQSKGDLQSSEKYYSRVIEAYPQDGEILSQYAALLWELYHDEKTSSTYLERAIEAAPGDSNILAAYARFLWTVDKE